ncbi:MAG TPA: ABC transporter permease [Acidimicrobiales bacterium]|nr:ABC transporter permease [Acidimicrobiales bacterium]
MSVTPINAIVASSLPVTAGPPAGRYRLVDLCRSEWAKLRTVRSTMWTLGVTLVVGVGVAVLATAEARAHWSTMTPSDRASFDPTRLSLVGTLFGQLSIGVLGVLVMGSEYGTGTIRATLSAAPRRLRVLVAKVAVFGAVALAVSEIVSFLSFFFGQAMLTAPAAHATLATPGALRAVAGTGVFLCLVGLLALGLATVIRHTAGAISAYVAILLVLPAIVTALPSSLQDDVARFLPAVIGTVVFQTTRPSWTFSPAASLLLVALYAAVLLALGGFLLTRRDA